MLSTRSFTTKPGALAGMGLNAASSDAPNSTQGHNLNATFAALADPTRRAILARLAQGETVVGELVKPFGISGPAISRHLRVLEQAKLIERRVNAQWRMCRLQPAGLRVADDWLKPYRDYWEQNLDRLVEVLESQPPPTPPATGSATGADTTVGSRSAQVLSASLPFIHTQETP